MGVRHATSPCDDAGSDWSAIPRQALANAWQAWSARWCASGQRHAASCRRSGRRLHVPAEVAGVAGLPERPHGLWFHICAIMPAAASTSSNVGVRVATLPPQTLGRRVSVTYC
jgi:hypothetical protein